MTEPSTSPGTPSTSPGTTITAPLEALLLMATEPLGVAELAQALDVPTPVVWAALEEIAAFYDETGRGFQLRQVGEGWRLYTRPEHHDVIAAWVLEGQQARLSQAALETLAVVAYLQPISRSRVGSIRGVNVDGVMRTLATRGLIEEAGHSEETGAMLWRTSALFLEKMGHTSLDDLPPIAPHLPEASLLEAELAGLAETPRAREDGSMTENSEIPSAEQASTWADEEAAETRSDADQVSADEVPDADELDRLSEPS